MRQGRFCHRIGANASCRTPSSLLVISCASEPIKSTPCNRSEERAFTSGYAMYLRFADGCETRSQRLVITRGDGFTTLVERFASKHRPLMVVGYGILEHFRLLGGFAWLSRQRPDEWKLVFGPRPVIMSGRVNGCTVHILDLANWYAAEWTQIVGRADKRHDVREVAGTGGQATGDSCQVACEATLAAMLNLWRWWRDIDGGVCGKTIAQCAWNSWRHGWRASPSGVERWTAPEKRARAGRATSPPAMVHDDLITLALERRAHYGGRVDAYRIGRIPGRWYAVDGNSMYPFVMRGSEQPARLAVRRFRPHRDLLAWLLSEYTCAADVLVSTEDDRYPRRRDGKLCYPVGEFHTTLCGQELVQAYQSGAIIEVIHVCAWERKDLFTAWVDYFYSLKMQAAQQGDVAHKTLIGQLLQSLYGKTVQHSATWVSEPGIPAPVEFGYFTVRDAPRNINHQCLAIGWHTLRREPDREAIHSMPIIGACICADARQRVFAARVCAGASHVAHEQTDCLIVDDEGLQRLRDAGWIDATEIGKFKVACQGDDLHIRHAGDYTLGGERVISGVPPSAEEIGLGRYQYRRLRSVLEDWQRGAVDTVIYQTQEVDRRQTALRRKVGPNGFTRPPVLSELFDPTLFNSTLCDYRSPT